ncbi:high mobility group B protein 6-like, partial [Camellia sinensis]|uniref:high mobility group B protein 6-like n=1 Tax=Camellia sinensis TaxID=4442 RepID=UPI001036D1F7
MAEAEAKTAKLERAKKQIAELQFENGLLTGLVSSAEAEKQKIAVMVKDKYLRELAKLEGKKDAEIADLKKKISDANAQGFKEAEGLYIPQCEGAKDLFFNLSPHQPMSASLVFTTEAMKLLEEEQFLQLNKKEKDPLKPKQPMSAFFMFRNERRAKSKSGWEIAKENMENLSPHQPMSASLAFTTEAIKLLEKEQFLLLNKKEKDPLKPKQPMSVFFMFRNERRAESKSGWKIAKENMEKYLEEIELPYKI